jgi:hypothetical protein
MRHDWYEENEKKLNISPCHFCAMMKQAQLKAVT